MVTEDQVRDLLARHRTVGRGWHDTVWLCASGCVVGVVESGTPSEKERQHQAEQVAATIGRL